MKSRNRINLQFKLKRQPPPRQAKYHPPREGSEVKFNDEKELKTEKHRIGGGQGKTVWRRFHIPSDRWIAIKDIDISHMQEGHIEREIILQNLNSPYIVSYYGGVEDSFKLLIAMECMNFGTLKDAKKIGHGIIPEKVVAAMTYSILQGLKYLHGLDPKHIHRDIKPQNILFNLDGKCKIGDLGSSRIPPGIQSLDSHGGTQSYMAPERMRGEQYDTPSDIYSLGITLYECLVGKHPFGDSTAEMLGSANGKSHGVILPGVFSKKCQNFFELCCKTDPNERSTADHLLYHAWIVTSVAPDSRERLISDWLQRKYIHNTEMKHEYGPPEPEISEMDNATARNKFVEYTTKCTRYYKTAKINDLLKKLGEYTDENIKKVKQNEFATIRKDVLGKVRSFQESAMNRLKEGEKPTKDMFAVCEDELQHLETFKNALTDIVREKAKEKLMTTCNVCKDRYDKKWDKCPTCDVVRSLHVSLDTKPVKLIDERDMVQGAALSYLVDLENPRAMNDEMRSQEVTNFQHLTEQTVYDKAQTKNNFGLLGVNTMQLGTYGKVRILVATTQEKIEKKDDGKQQHEEDQTVETIWVALSGNDVLGEVQSFCEESKDEMFKKIEEMKKNDGKMHGEGNKWRCDEWGIAGLCMKSLQLGAQKFHENSEGSRRLKRCVFVGHSLGGNLAHLCAHHINDNSLGYRCAQSIGFGSSLFMTNEIAKRIREERRKYHITVINQNDCFPAILTLLQHFMVSNSDMRYETIRDMFKYAKESLRSQNFDEHLLGFVSTQVNDMMERSNIHDRFFPLCGDENSKNNKSNIKFLHFVPFGTFHFIVKKGSGDELEREIFYAEGDGLMEIQRRLFLDLLITQKNIDFGKSRSYDDVFSIEMKIDNDTPEFPRFKIARTNDYSPVVDEVIVVENKDSSITIFVIGENLQLVHEVPVCTQNREKGAELLDWKTARLERKFSADQFEIRVDKLPNAGELYPLDQTKFEIKSMMGYTYYDIRTDDIRDLTVKYMADHEMEFMKLNTDFFKKAFLLGMFLLVNQKPIHGSAKDQRLSEKPFFGWLLRLIIKHCDDAGRNGMGEAEGVTRDIQRYVDKQKSGSKQLYEEALGVYRHNEHHFKEISEKLLTHEQFFLNSTNPFWIAIQKLFYRFQFRWYHRNAETVDPQDTSSYIQKLRALLAYVDCVGKKHPVIPDRPYELEKELCGAIKNMQDFKGSLLHFMISLDLPQANRMDEYVEWTDALIDETKHQHEPSDTYDSTLTYARSPRPNSLDDSSDQTIDWNYKLEGVKKYFLNIPKEQADRVIGDLVRTHNDAISFLQKTSWIHNIREQFMNTCILSITGMTKTGKSSLLNDLWNVGVRSGYELEDRTTRISLYRHDEASQVILADFPGHDEGGDNLREISQECALISTAFVIMIAAGQYNVKDAGIMIQELRRHNCPYLIIMSRGDVYEQIRDTMRSEGPQSDGFKATRTEMANALFQSSGREIEEENIVIYSRHNKHYSFGEEGLDDIYIGPHGLKDRLYELMKKASPHQISDKERARSIYSFYKPKKRLPPEGTILSDVDLYPHIPNTHTLNIIYGDICKIPAQAIVCTNDKDLYGSGVLGSSIYKEAGEKHMRKIQEEWRNNKKKLGETEVYGTPAFNLPHHVIIHVNTPDWESENRHELLKKAIKNILSFAEYMKCSSLCFPLLGSGYHCFPSQHAIEIIVQTLKEHVSPQSSIRNFYLVIFNNSTALEFVRRSNYYKKSREIFRGSLAPPTAQQKELFQKLPMPPPGGEPIIPKPVKPIHSEITDLDKYPLTAKKPRGFVLVIENTKPRDPRDFVSPESVNIMLSLFNDAGYKTYHLQNLTCDSIYTECRDLVGKSSKRRHDSFIFYFVGYGGKNFFCGADFDKKDPQEFVKHDVLRNNERNQLLLEGNPQRSQLQIDEKSIFGDVMHKKEILNILSKSRELRSKPKILLWHTAFLAKEKRQELSEHFSDKDFSEGMQDTLSVNVMSELNNFKEFPKTFNSLVRDVKRRSGRTNPHDDFTKDVILRMKTERDEKSYDVDVKNHLKFNKKYCFWSNALM